MALRDRPIVETKPQKSSSIELFLSCFTGSLLPTSRLVIYLYKNLHTINVIKAKKILIGINQFKLLIIIHKTEYLYSSCNLGKLTKPTK